MTSNGCPNRDQSPLLGVVLCCTSIPQEQRGEIAEIAQQMGAVHKLDLTSDVTHLLVGNIDTPKYKYVAKERLDIKVLSPAWIEAVRQSWMEGGETDVAALEEEHRLSPLAGLQICVTGFEDLQQRNWIAETVAANGAHYNGDLTKQVTHLVAVAPRGKKYEYAGQWQIKIVTIEWLHASLDRGMALEESLYHPAIPAEERGQGAVVPRRMSPGKRERPGDQSGEIQDAGRRKLRRTTSSKLESQHDNIWDDIGSGEQAKPLAADAEWAEAPQHAAKRRPAVSDQRGSVTILRYNSAVGNHRTSVGQGEDKFQKRREGVFASQTVGEAFYIYGFDPRKQDILDRFLVANGAIVLSPSALEEIAPQANAYPKRLIEDYWRLNIVVPYDISIAGIKHIKATHNYLSDMSNIVTEWFIEKSLHNKAIADSSLIRYQPLLNFPLHGFENLTICPTSFRGIDLLHFSKAVKLIGANYDESLKPATSVMVCCEGSPSAEKLAYALERRIPVVHADWFWTCIQRNKLCPFDDFLVSTRSTELATSNMSDHTQARRTREVINPEEQQEENQDKKRSLQSREIDDLSQSAPTKEDKEDATCRVTGPLHELPSHGNSPRKSSESKCDLAASEGFERDSNEHATPPTACAEVPSKTEPNSLNGEALNNAIEHLRAHRKAAELISSLQNSITDNKGRRHRPLGRAISNPSSHRSSGPSRSNSMQRVPEPFDSEDMVMPKREDSGSMGFRPSQTLTYDDPEALAAREKLLKRMGANASLEDDRDRKMQTVESIGIVKDASFGPGDDKTKRRGTRKR